MLHQHVLACSFICEQIREDISAKRLNMPTCGPILATNGHHDVSGDRGIVIQPVSQLISTMRIRTHTTEGFWHLDKAGNNRIRRFGFQLVPDFSGTAHSTWDTRSRRLCPIAWPGTPHQLEIICCEPTAPCRGPAPPRRYS